MDNTAQNYEYLMTFKAPQIKHAEPDWRMPDEDEKKFIRIHWEPLFKKNCDVSQLALSILYTLLGLLFAFLFVYYLQKAITLCIIFGIVCISFVQKAIRHFKKYNTTWTKYQNIRDCNYQVYKATATGLRLISWTDEENPLKEYSAAYVNVYDETHPLIVEDIKIPYKLAESLKHLKTFPCIIIKVKKNDEWLALPKFR